MVSNVSIIFMVVSLLICLFVPIGLAVFAYKKYRISIKAVLIGALIFFVFQIVLRIPLLTFISKQHWYQWMAENTLLIALFLGLTAGLFEEIGRFIGYKLFLKEQLEWKNGIAFGIGHGGIEAVLITGMTMVNNIVLSFMINTGGYGALVGARLPAASAQAIKNSLISGAPYTFAIGGVERIFAIAVQIALSLLILYGVMNRKTIYLLYAILLHALIDAPVVYMGMKGYGILIIEGLVALMALIAIFYIIRSGEIFRRCWIGTKVSYIEKT